MPNEPFSHARLILVEGHGDAGFFRNLIRIRGLADHFHIREPKASGAPGSGNTMFTEALNALSIDPDFRSNIQRILIVSDNDENPTQSFKSIQRQIRATVRRYKAPRGRLSATTGSPSITIMMIPSTRQPGNLESLCWEAALRNPANADAISCIEPFLACTGIEHWPMTKQAKIKFRCLVAARYQRNCDLSLVFLWDNVPDLIPLDDPIFDPIVTFLRTF